MSHHVVRTILPTVDGGRMVWTNSEDALASISRYFFPAHMDADLQVNDEIFIHSDITDQSPVILAISFSHRSIFFDKTNFVKKFISKMEKCDNYQPRHKSFIRKKLKEDNRRLFTALRLKNLKALAASFGYAFALDLIHMWVSEFELFTFQSYLISKSLPVGISSDTLHLSLMSSDTAIASFEYNIFPYLTTTLYAHLASELSANASLSAPGYNLISSLNSSIRSGTSIVSRRWLRSALNGIDIDETNQSLVASGHIVCFNDYVQLKGASILESSVRDKSMFMSTGVPRFLDYEIEEVIDRIQTLTCCTLSTDQKQLIKQTVNHRASCVHAKFLTLPLIDFISRTLFAMVNARTYYLSSSTYEKTNEINRPTTLSFSRFISGEITIPKHSLVIVSNASCLGVPEFHLLLSRLPTQCRILLEGNSQHCIQSWGNPFAQFSRYYPYLGKNHDVRTLADSSDDSEGAGRWPCQRLTPAIEYDEARKHSI